MCIFISVLKMTLCCEFLLFCGSCAVCELATIAARTRGFTQFVGAWTNKPLQKWPRQTICRTNRDPQEAETTEFLGSCWNCKEIAPAGDILPPLLDKWRQFWKMIDTQIFCWTTGKANQFIVHCCTLSLCYLVAETDDQHRNTNIKNKDHLVGD